MDTPLTADVFFLISGIAVAVLTVTAVAHAYFAMRAYRSVELLAEHLHARLNEFEEDVGYLKRTVTGNIRLAVRLAELAASFFMSPRDGEETDSFRRHRG